MPSPNAPSFAVLVPVKTWSRAKTRLGIDDPAVHQRLAAAFAHDTVAAALASPYVASVHVITDEPDFRPPGVHLVPDEGDGDLNEALRRAADRLHTLDHCHGIVALLADLPCLRTVDLDAALLAFDGGRWFVADAEGTGTTMLVSTGELDPHFGRDSAARHLASGARPYAGPARTLRRDVDTIGDLAAAISLGVGTHTAAALPEGERRH